MRKHSSQRETVNAQLHIAHEDITESTAFVRGKVISIYGALSFDKYTGNGLPESQHFDELISVIDIALGQRRTDSTRRALSSCIGLSG